MPMPPFASAPISTFPVDAAEAVAERRAYVSSLAASTFAYVVPSRIATPALTPNRRPRARSGGRARCAARTRRCARRPRNRRPCVGTRRLGYEAEADGVAVVEQAQLRHEPDVAEARERRRALARLREEERDVEAERERARRS